jgi:hypothetical protein
VSSLTHTSTNQNSLLLHNKKKAFRNRRINNQQAEIHTCPTAQSVGTDDTEHALMSPALTFAGLNTPPSDAHDPVTTRFVEKLKAKRVDPTEFLAKCKKTNQ